ncbi:hypothetical protein TWF481_003116 [Arthrobotrys musiformis]|uniref:Azaphilone pigments biosynthesis cluster protein L N-terminal domain-containing protein n=1 Tax=Arthrobotrys musiformis TaxID=47236 RepID=A0AAV9VQC6_9PEZI
MDPLSITASVIAVVTAACQVSNGLIKLTTVLKEAPDIVMALQNEVNDIQIVVHTARDVLQQRFGQQNGTAVNISSQVDYLRGSLERSKILDAKDELRGIRLEVVNGLQLACLGSALHMECQISALENIIRQGFLAQARGLNNGLLDLNRKIDDLSEIQIAH